MMLKLLEVIDLPFNTPIFQDMNLVGYSEQYHTILNGTISDTVTFGVGDFLTGTLLH